MGTQLVNRLRGKHGRSAVVLRRILTTGITAGACCADGMSSILLRGNQRYLAFLDGLDDTCAGQRDLQRSSQSRVQANTGQSVKGLNFFNPAEQRLLQTLQHGEFNIYGWRRADLIPHVPLPTSALSRQVASLRMLGLIKKVARTAIASSVWAALQLQQRARLPNSTSARQWPVYVEVFRKCEDITC